MADNQAPTSDEKIAALEVGLGGLMTKFEKLADYIMSRKDSADTKADADRADDKAAKDAARDTLFGGKRKADASKADEAEDEDDDDDKKEAKSDESEDEDKDKDEDDKEEKRDDEAGDPAPMAADDDRRKDRKDWESDNVNSKNRASWRGDADEEDKDEKKDAERSDARADATAREMQAMREQIARLQREVKRPRPMTDDEMNDLAERQQEWARVAQMHGTTPIRPMDGERINTYDRRMSRAFQKYSPKWKDTDLSQMPPDVISKIIAPEIRADTASAAYRVDPAEGGMLREIRRTDRTGRVISEFVGPVGAVNGALAPFRMPSARVRRINTNPNLY